MKKLFNIALLFFLSATTYSQYGNEWIDYNQTYYKFPIYEDGVYRITYNDLSNSGFPVASVDPRNIQIFGHEEEVALNIEGEQDGVFDASDYIEFYAHKADGRLDSLLYVNPSDHPNKFYNFFNDTINYFITWNNLTTNKRLTKSGSSNYSSYSPQPYFYKQVRYSENTYYTYDQFNGHVADPRYFAGEGFGSALYTKGETYIKQISISNLYQISGGPRARVYSCSGTSGKYIDNFEDRKSHVSIEYSNSPTTFKTIFNNVRLKPKVDKLNFTIPNDELFNGQYSFKYSLLDDLGTEQDFMSFSELNFDYPSQINVMSLYQLKFLLHSEISQPMVRLDVSNIVGTSPKILGIQNSVLVDVFNDGSDHFLIPNPLPSSYYYYTEEAIKTILKIDVINSTGKFENYLTQGATNNFVVITHKKLWSKAIEYKQYRETLAGGGYNVVLVDIEELYSQFGEGVNKSSIAIRRYLKALLDKWLDLKGVFLIGKGVHNARHVRDGSWGTRKDNVAYKKCLIPVLGAPATDNVFSLGLSGDWNNMDVPIGRYAANDTNELDLYINKIIEYESNLNLMDYSVEANEWKKQILHFIGGSNDDEQKKFLNLTRFSKKQIEDIYYGATVKEFLKKGSEPISPTDLHLLTEKIQNGVSIMQLFGHSNYSTGFDTNLDNASNWNNKGKYPIVVANGCNSGDIFLNLQAKSNSEDYVIQKDEGAIMYISTTTSGYDYPLAYVTESLYKNISYDNYQKEIGIANMNAVSFQLRNYSDIRFSSSIATFNIHGDPMIKVYPFEKPELVLPYYSIRLDPEIPTLQDEVINVYVDVYNIGRAFSEDVSIELKRTYPNGIDSIYTKTISGVHNQTTIVFELLLDPSKSEGINTISVSIDIPSLIEEEYDEINNNQTSKQLFILTDGIQPILPTEFAIVGKEDKLYASTINPDQSLNSYIIEIDTTDEFNSSEWRYIEASSNGGTIEVEHTLWLSRINNASSPLVFKDSSVYFWRVSEKSVIDWKESSFQYIKDKYGWGQAHFFQFKSDDFTKLNYDKTGRNVTFDFTDIRLTVQMYSNPTTGAQYGGTKYIMFNKVMDSWGGGQLSPAINIAVINPDDLNAWGTPKWVDDDGDGTPETLYNPTHYFGQYNIEGSAGRKYPDKYFTYVQSDQTQLQSIETLLNAVPDGHYVLFYTFVKADYTQWDALYPNLYNVFQSLGADQMVTGQQDNMFAILCLKGDPTFTKQYFSPPIGSSTDFYSQEFIFSATPVGYIDAPKAGPAQEWNAIYWQQHPKEPTLGDTTHLYVYGVNFNDDEFLLIDTVMTRKDSIINLQNRFDANKYPYLKLQSRFGDNVTLTPSHLERWQILYTPVPEASVEPSLGVYYSAKENTVLEGEDVNFSVAFKNISSISMDSILVKYWITDKFNKNHTLKEVRLDSLRVGQVIKDTLKFNTRGFDGTNSLWFEINPISQSTGRPDQLEQHHFNNYYQKTLIVDSDKENPLLDVTFDGVHIFDGDIVSPSPKILIKFSDENQYLKYSAETDTNLFSVSLIYPDQIAESQVYFTNGLGEKILDWRVETSGNKNQFIIEYNPKDLPDGVYKLKAQGSDVSFNISGDLSYEVEFEVVNASTITYFYNYPNPFSTRTQFVFTVTGSEIPDEINIQIITVTGKIVKTITAAELGPIHIGKNVTQYYWNGTDDFGDPLANGVYLYKVSAKIKGETIEHRETSKDNLFKHQFGKLYIMR